MSKQSRNQSVNGPTPKKRGVSLGPEREVAAVDGDRPKKKRRNRGGQHGVPGSVDDARRCTATAHRTGERCRAPAIKGSNVCRVHGGAAPQTKAKAKERLLALVDPALAELQRIIANTTTSDADKLRAIQMVLDRTGFKPGMLIEVGLSRFDEMLAGAIGMDPNTGVIDLSRALPPSPEPGALNPGEQDGVWQPDVEQVVRSAQDDVDRERHDEETRTYLAGRIYPDENTVRGEVILPGVKDTRADPSEFGGYPYPRQPN